MRVEYVVPIEAAGTRLDVWLTEQIGISRATIQKSCKAGEVVCNGQVRKANYRLEGGEQVVITYELAVDELPEPEDIPVDVVYEDEDMLVINKPRGMVVHPAAGHRSKTLVNALLHYTKGNLADTGDPLRPGIVHRLDRDTSGLMMVAKTERGYRSLTEQIRAHTAERIYLALVHGTPASDRAVIRLPLGRDPKDRLKRAVLHDGGKEAVTHFTVLERLDGFALLKCRLETGRTHQIRVHLAHIGLPVVQDPLYGRRKDHFPIDGQALHAAALSWQRPGDGELLKVEAPLPEDFEACLAKARKERE